MYYWKHDFLYTIQWLPNYKREDLMPDVVAGVTLSTMICPQSMAYAMLAGMFRG